MTTRRSKRYSSLPDGEDERVGTQETMSPPPPPPSLSPGRGHVRTRSQSRLESSQQESSAYTPYLSQCSEYGPAQVSAAKRRRQSPRDRGGGPLGDQGGEDGMDPLLNDSPSISFMYSQQQSQPHSLDGAESSRTGPGTVYQHTCHF